MNGIKRVLRWSVGALVAFEVVYVLAAIIVVQSGQVDRWVNTHPEKLKITFASAWTFIPGLVHLGGVRVVNQGRGNQLEAVVDKAWVFVNPIALIGKRVQALGFRARGVEFRYRKRPKTPEEALELAKVVPSIEGAPLEPYAGPPKDEKEDGRQPKAGKREWAVDVRDARLADVREVWMGGLRLRGHGDVDASVLVETGAGTRLSLRRAELRYDGGEVDLKDQPFSRALKMHVAGKMEPFNTRETKGKAILGLVTAQVELEAQNAGQILNYYYDDIRWLRFEGQPRRLTAQLAIERGKVKPGGRVELAKGPLGAEFAGFIAEGQAGVRLLTVPARAGGGTDAEVRVDFSDYGMRRLAEGPPVMKGAGLFIEARSPADLEKMPPKDVEGQIQLGKAEFPDLTFVNALLPGGKGLVKNGRASVDGGFQIGLGGACHGEVKVGTAELVVQSGGVATRGDVEVTIAVPDGDLNALRFGLDDTRVEFANFDFESQAADKSLAPWKGRFAVIDGTLDLGEDRGVDIRRLDLRFTDTRPLIAFLSQNKPLPGWQENLLMIEDIKGEGIVVAQPGQATVRHFGVRGEKLDVRFRAAVGAQGAFGKAIAKYSIVKVGIGLEGKERDLKLIRVGSWYKKEDDIRGMPKLIPKYAEKIDLEAEEREAQEYEAAEAAKKQPEEPPEPPKPPEPPASQNPDEAR
jgi:hypothetical protein